LNWLGHLGQVKSFAKGLAKGRTLHLFFNFALTVTDPVTESGAIQLVLPTNTIGAVQLLLILGWIA
jgi:hypothetical protein